MEMLNRVAMIDLFRIIIFEVFNRPDLTHWDFADHQPGFVLDRLVLRKKFALFRN